MSLFQARDKIICDAEVVCSTLSSCISSEIVDIGSELKYDVSTASCARARLIIVIVQMYTRSTGFIFGCTVDGSIVEIAMI